MSFKVHTLPEGYSRMIPSTYDRLLAAALDEVNDIRIALVIGEGKLPALPPGVQGHKTMCVLARALSNGWRATVGSVISLEGAPAGFDFDKAAFQLQRMGYSVRYQPAIYGESLKISSTPVMRHLIGLFDEGSLPSLILEERYAGYTPS